VPAESVRVTNGPSNGRPNGSPPGRGPTWDRVRAQGRDLLLRGGPMLGLLMLVSYTSWSLYTVVLKWSPKELGHLELACLLAGVGVLCFAPFYDWEISQGLGFELDTANIAVILYSAIFPSFLAYVFWNRGVAALGPNQAGYSQYLVPPFGIVLASAILGETVHDYHWVGIVAIFIGVWLATRKGSVAAH